MLTRYLHQINLYSGSQKDEVRCWAWALKRLGGYVSCRQSYLIFLRKAIYRFGNRLQYNQFSQRSEQIDSAKPEATIRILMTGDSVLNGNNTTDRIQTIT